MTTTRRAKPPRRGRPPATDADRKDRLIQTRVEEDLDEALRAAAKKQRVTVSQLIRNVLHDTFQLVDDIVANTASLTESVKRDARRIAASAQGFSSVEAAEEAAAARAAAAQAKAAAAAAAATAATAAAATAAVPAAAPSAAVTAAAAGEPAALGPDVLEAVLAWQEVVMGRERPCARCACKLGKGDKGFLGVTDEPAGPRPFICAPCAAALGQAE